MNECAGRTEGKSSTPCTRTHASLSHASHTLTTTTMHPLPYPLPSPACAPAYLLLRFSAGFEYDANGVPRQWHTLSPEQVRDAYTDAKQAALELVEIFGSKKNPFGTHIPVEKWTPLPADVESKIEQPLMKEDKILIVTQGAVKAMQRLWRDAQRAASGGGQAHVPTWMYFLLAALGYNEATTLLTNPLVLIIVVLIAVAASFAYYAGIFQSPMQAVQQGASMSAKIIITLLQKLQGGSNGSTSVVDFHSAPPSPTASPRKKTPISSSKTASLKFE
eukprot:GHVU01042014.1.p1 GENE.GHVU01042014.1~~GHVU01042014.1.p1  ORF type:complete len:276 (-),score=42.01 GHVU01042014.1:412-1239(-)